MNADAQQSIRRLVEELNAAVSRDGAKVELTMQGTPNEQELAVTATQEGLLRLGIELMKAALEPTSEAPIVGVPIDLEYLETDNSEVSLCVTRVDQFAPPPVRNPPSGCSSPAFFLVAAVSCVGALMIVGFVTIVRWVFGF